MWTDGGWLPKGGRGRPECCGPYRHPPFWRPLTEVRRVVGGCLMSLSATRGEVPRSTRFSSGGIENFLIFFRYGSIRAFYIEVTAS